MRTRSFLVLPGLLALAAMMACDSDGSRAYHGCELIYQRGNWDTQRGLELVHNEPRECPIQIYVIGERVNTAGDLYDNSLQFDVAELEMRDSRDRFLNDDQRRFQDFMYGTSVASLLVDYPAATGYRTFGDYDDALFGAVDDFQRIRADMRLRNRTRRGDQMAVIIAGSSIPQGNSTVTWSASGSGGNTPYRYSWYRDGTLVGSGESYTANVGTTDFTLRVEMTDTYGRSIANFMGVDVDGVAVQVSGPTLVYASQGGGTWTASGAGGKEPYTYNWYVDGVNVGSGASWNGYPGEGEKELRIEMRDAAGALDGATTRVQGLGTGDGTCDPVPPQLTCSPEG